MSSLPTFDPGFTTDRMAEIFSAERRVGAMVSFEVALASAEAAAGLISHAAADEIRSAAGSLNVDAAALLREGWEAGTPLIPLLTALRADLGDEATEALHRGATSQDAVDTATMLQVRSGLGALEASLIGVAEALRSLAVEHRSTPMMGRSFLQHGEPTSFGLRAARWLEPVLRHVEALRSVQAGLVVQLGGPMGDLSSFGPEAGAVVEGLADRLELAAPVVPWHTDRSRIADLVSLVERLAHTMAKIGMDLALLAQTEVGEVRMRAGGSSSMAHKRNPFDAVRAVAAADAASGVAVVVTGGRPHELERGLGGWHAEWFAVPLVFQAAAASVEAIGRCMESLEVDTERMRTNLGGQNPVDRVGPDALIDQVLAAATRTLGVRS